jgi:ectoine hydroxylase-related dioxygenase (phytanoyl-CoA dioxygenase family)
MVALLSKPGCKAQLAHTDYTPATLANATDETMPLACLVALENGTAFDVWPEAIRFEKNVSYKHMQVKLNKGDVLVFRGDLVHGGAACGEVENVRIHAYLDVEGVERPKHGDDSLYV